MHFHRLWNGMFDRHQAEITVMQFTCHSLPVHQSVAVPWDFNPVPYCQPIVPTPKKYALPLSLEWHVWRGRRSIYNINLYNFLRFDYNVHNHLHTIIWLHAFQYNSDNFHQIYLIHRWTLTDSTTLGCHGSNRNKWVLYLLLSSRTEASLADPD